MQETGIVQEVENIDFAENNEGGEIEVSIPFETGELRITTTKQKIAEAYARAANELALKGGGIKIPETSTPPEIELMNHFNGYMKRYFGVRKSREGKIEINLGRIAEFVSNPGKSISVDMGKDRPSDEDTKVLLFKKVLNIIFLHEVRHDLEIFESPDKSMKKMGEAVNSTLLRLIGSRGAIATLAVADMALAATGLNDTHVVLLVGGGVSLLSGQVLAPNYYKNTTAESDARNFSLEEQDLPSPFNVEYLK